MIDALIKTPIGRLRASFASNGNLRLLRFEDDEAPPEEGRTSDGASALTSQIAAYFRGERGGFDLPLALEGGAFEQRVWTVLQSIPFGATVTYGGLAEQLGVPGGAQAVGRACAANPALIVAPCHRVVGTGGALTGYAGGAERKAALLRHEGALLV